MFGKVGTSGAEFQKSMVGKKIVGAGRQGKYFWFGNPLDVFMQGRADQLRMVMDSPPHPVMHLGMTGTVKLDLREMRSRVDAYRMALYSRPADHALSREGIR